MTIDEMAARTPDTRDRYMDFLRAVSILVVVFGHWFIGVNQHVNGVYYTTSAIGSTRWMWLSTWFLMVMPVFFFVGGFANFTGYTSFIRKGETDRAFRHSRVIRLLKPSAVFLGIWAAIQLALHVADIGGQAGFLRGVQPPGSTVPFGPLWFLPVYVGMVLLVPLTIRLHLRFGAAVPAVMLALVCATDAIAFGFGLPGLRWVNAIMVWVLPHQLGYFYADGTLQRAGKGRAALLAAAGLGGLIVLTTVGGYPKSMLGTGKIGVWGSISSSGLVNASANMARWLSNARPWKATIAVNGSIMSLYLWHMTAYLLAMLALMPLGIGTPRGTDATWWLQRPLWLAVPAVILVGFVAVFRRYERPGLPITR